MSPLCLCDYCPRAWHLCCLGSAPAPGAPQPPAWAVGADFSKLTEGQWACPRCLEKAGHLPPGSSQSNPEAGPLVEAPPAQKPLLGQGAVLQAPPLPGDKDMLFGRRVGSGGLTAAERELLERSSAAERERAERVMKKEKDKEDRAKAKVRAGMADQGGGGGKGLALCWPWSKLQRGSPSKLRLSF